MKERVCAPSLLPVCVWLFGQRRFLKSFRSVKLPTQPNTSFCSVNRPHTHTHARCHTTHHTNKAPDCQTIQQSHLSKDFAQRSFLCSTNNHSIPRSLTQTITQRLPRHLKQSLRCFFCPFVCLFVRCSVCCFVYYFFPSSFAISHAILTDAINLLLCSLSLQGYTLSRE
jgi:hypothetical protein